MPHAAGAASPHFRRLLLPNSVATLQPLIGNRLGHYLVLEKLGSGGMGDVYVAEDTTLNRRVALKFLRSDVADARDNRGRILREARAAAALNHPNIVHLYSVEEVDDLVRHSDGRSARLCARRRNRPPGLETRQCHDY